MNRIKLIELIEGEAAKLSPQGRELWEQQELMIQSEPDEASSATLSPPSTDQVEILERMTYLPDIEQGILERLMELHAGLYSSEFAERRGELGELHRNRAVILAAGLKDRREGRQIDPEMTPEQAAARLQDVD